MYFRSALTTLVLFVFVGCAQPTNTKRTIVEGIYPGRELGVTVDVNLKIVDLDPQGAAAAADLRVGDILIDLTLVEMGETISRPSDAVSLEAPMPTQTATGKGPPLPPEAGVDNDTIVPTTTPQSLPAYSDSVSNDTNSASDEIVITPEVIGETVPFTDREQVKRLIGLNATLKLRLERDGSILEIVLQTTPRAPRPDSPTPTPVIPPYDYY